MRSVGRGAQNLEAPQYPFLYKDVKWPLAVGSICILLTAYCQQLTIIGELYKKESDNSMIIGVRAMRGLAATTPHSSFLTPHYN